jgi:hypothetical protein
MKTTQLIKTLIPTLILSHSAWAADLINVDFGSHLRGGGQTVMEVGFAATGISANDYWNFYSNDNPDGTWKVNGFLSNLKYAGGVASGVGITVNNADGSWGYAGSDPMFSAWIYSLSDVQTSVSVANLSAGTYNFYLYAGDSQFNLKVGNKDYGTKVAYVDAATLNPPPWVEGKQYVLFSNVEVGASQTALISLGAGQDYPKGIIAGMQIELVPEPSCSMLLCFGGLFLAYRARKTR